MRRRARDLPLQGDATSRFLPWIISAMVFLAALALAATMFVSAAGADWRRGLSSTLTAQIMPPAAGIGDRAGVDAFEARTRAALKLLQSTPGVARAELLPDSKVRALIEPWLGAGEPVKDLPLPRLIDIRLDTDAPADVKALAARLTREVRGASLDDHGVWLARLLKVADVLEAVAIVALALISAAAIATVVFSTGTGLAIHHEVIEVLHLAGARDGYIANQFQAHALWLTLKGGIIGAAAAAITLILLQQVGEGLKATMLPAFSLSVTQWVAIGALPLAAGAISVVTARLTVLRRLGRML